MIARGFLLHLASGFALLAQAPTAVFEQQIQPLLAKHCGACHGAAAKIQQAGLTLDTPDGVRAAVTPGDPAGSLLVKALRTKMPPAGRLPEGEIARVEEWIRNGAHLPATAGAAAKGSSFSVAQRKATHWAWKPVRPGNPDVDAHIDAKLRAAGIPAAKEASREALARRLAFDLTGLPLPAAERERFLADPAPDAYARLVDRLLASPAFGERWARHWMDLVRYSESHGSEGDPDVPQAWRYRDYLIRAFNADVPYDQLIREHLAGDLLAKPRIDAGTRTNESLLGLAHLRMVEHGFQPVDPWEDRVKWVDNQVDVFAKAFQGLTISCARCHDHKFDAISQKDYYALFGIFANARPTQRAIDAPEDLERGLPEMRAVKARMRAALAAKWREAAPAAVAAREKAKAAGSGDARIVWDLRRPADAAQWKGHGSAPAAGPGEFAVALDGGRAVTTLLPGGVYSHLLSDKQGAVYSSPRFKIDSDYISVRLMGGNYAFAQIVVENYAVNRGGIYQLRRSPVEPRMQWATIKTEFWKGFTAYVEVVTQDDVTHLTLSDADFQTRPRPQPVRNGRSWFGVQAVAFHNSKEPPAEEGFDGPVDVRAAIDAWEAGRASEAQVAGLNALLAEGRLPAALPELQAEYLRLDAALPVARRAPGVFEEAGAAQALLIRGGHKNPGPVVERRYLEALGSTDYPDAGTARLRLAGEVLDAGNPLTSRVAVNRVWAKIFGKGLVATVDNFGRLGEMPSHPELLDALAHEFRTTGWRMKPLIRKLVMSAAYRRVSQAGAEARQADPANRLLSHMPLKRMEAEVLRDTMLALSGRLDRQMYGRSVPVYYLHETGKTKGDRPKGPADGAGRRSVYLEVRRNATNPLLEVFDFPVPASTRGERDWTNVPAQSLALLNSPFVIEQAGRWAKAELAAGGDVAGRMFTAALGRGPAGRERSAMAALAADLRAEHGGDEGKTWRDVAQSLFNLKEFLYIP